MRGDRQDTFNLTEELAFAWRTVGIKFGMDDYALKYIHDQLETDTQRLEIVWNKWINHASYQKKYFFNWEGLYQLLEDIKQRDIAVRFNNFLSSNENIFYSKQANY